MNKTGNMHAYWILLNCLCGSFPWLKWLMLLGLGVVVLGVPIYGVWNNFVVLMIGSSVVFFVICVNTISLPNQVLAINSSKQIGLLPNLRCASFIIFMLMCISVSLVVAALVSLKEHEVNIHSFFASLVLLSVVLIGNIVAAQRYQGMQVFIFFFLWALSPVYKWLIQVHWVALCIGIIALWIGFFFHWRKWRPIKFHQNIFGMSYDQQLAFSRQGSAHASMWFQKIFSVKPVSLIDSLLLGRADGWKSKLITAASMLLGLIVFIGIFSVISDKENFKRFIAGGGQVNIYVMYFCIGYGLLTIIFRNISKLWLYFEGKRSQFFSYLERVFYSALLVLGVPILLAHIAVTYFILDWQLYYELIWLTVLYSLISIVITLYVNLFIYHKTKGSLRWSGLVGVLLMIVLGIPVISCNVMWIERKMEIIHIAYFLIIGLVIGILVLRFWLKKQWLLVDFVRVKS